ncbi:MAG: hypothetical protein ABI763_01105, partial [Bacteroidota bacterium]
PHCHRWQLISLLEFPLVVLSMGANIAVSIVSGDRSLLGSQHFYRIFKSSNLQIVFPIFGSNEPVLVTNSHQHCSEEQEEKCRGREGYIPFSAC